MLKTLRVTSLVVVAAAAIGVIAIAVLGLKGDPQIKAFLAKPGIVDELREKAGQEGVQEEKSSPLVAMAKAIALRFDPPPPPKPVVKGKPKPPAETARTKPGQDIPQPKVKASAKFDLLATVVYETAPEKSLALLQTAGNRQEWFRQGERAGYMELQEIRDGSVIFFQRGKDPEEIFVPAKPQSKSLLKGEQVSSTRPGSIQNQLPVSSTAQLPTVDTEPKAATSETTNSGKIRMTRTADQTSSIRSQTQRVRSTPPVASPQEQKRSVDKTISGIEAIMKRQDEAVSGGDRKKENEMWMRLLKELNEEKKNLEFPAEESSENDTSKTEKPEESTPQTSRGVDTSAPSEREVK
jgi:hypothetical protein